MKNLITLIMLLIAFSAAAQTSTVPTPTPGLIDPPYKDDLGHFVGGFSVTAVSYFGSYVILREAVKLKPKHCKLIAFGTSLLINVGVSCLKKKRHEQAGYTYNARAIAFDQAGGLTIAIAMPLVFFKDRKK